MSAKVTNLKARRRALAEELAEELDLHVSDVKSAPYDQALLIVRPHSAPEREYLVLTEPEARRRTTEYIKESLWAFRAEFVIKYTCLPADSVPMVRGWQETQCEGANETLLKLVGRKLHKLIDDAVAADGRGCFLAGYDHEELRRGPWYIYRTH